VKVDAAQVLAFRLGRSGLAVRRARTLAEAAACPASDFARDAALLALAARAEDVTREGYAEAIEAGTLGLAHTLRCAIHAFPPGDLAVYGRPLVGRDERELVAQLGRDTQRLAASGGLTLVEALAEVTAATEDALAGGVRLDKVERHAELRARVREELLPWCRGCGSNHVPPSTWRYATVQAGARLDSTRRYLLGDPQPAPPAGEPVRRFLRFYGPAVPGDFAGWAGVTPSHARRLWDEASGELVEVQAGGDRAWLPRDDVPALESPPAAEGVRLLPPGDPYLQKPNRPLLAPDADLRKRMFRPVASPGAVLKDGRLAGLWRVTKSGRKAEVAVEKLARISRADLEEEAWRVGALRGATAVAVDLS
jgi:hypothetical protein